MTDETTALAALLQEEWDNADDYAIDWDRIAARLIAAGVRVAPSDKDAMEGVACDWDEDGNCRCVRVAPSPTEPPCGDDSWDTRYECVKPSGHPVEGPGLTSHEYRFKRATSRVAPSPETPRLRKAAQAYLDAFDMPLTTDPEVHYDTLTAAREALRAALASPPAPAGLDVERLARAIEWEDVADGLEVALSYPAEMEVNRERWRASRIAVLDLWAALAAQSKEPTDA